MKYRQNNFIYIYPLFCVEWYEYNIYKYLFQVYVVCLFIFYLNEFN